MYLWCVVLRVSAVFVFASVCMCWRVCVSGSLCEVWFVCVVVGVCVCCGFVGCLVLVSESLSFNYFSERKANMHTIILCGTVQP